MLVNCTKKKQNQEIISPPDFKLFYLPAYLKVLSSEMDPVEIRLIG